MSTQRSWRRDEKTWYGIGPRPVELEIPVWTYFVIEGEGDPNGPLFAEHVAALYTWAYAVRMAPRAGWTIPGAEPFTVYPLEGLWDLRQAPEAPGAFRKDDLVYRLMIRQPEFVDDAVAERVRRTVAAKGLPHLDRVRREVGTDGRCVQMLHVGPFADEPASFRQMEDFCRKQSLARVGHVHREIYLTDPRRSDPAKQKTLLRFPVRDHYACD